MTQPRMNRLLHPETYKVDDFAEAQAMDGWLDHLQTLSIAIAQRRMTADQLDRYARLILALEQDAIGRTRQPSVRGLGRAA